MIMQYRMHVTGFLFLAAIMLVLTGCAMEEASSDFSTGFENLDTTPPVFSAPIVNIPSAVENAERVGPEQFRIIGFGESLGMPPDPEPADRLSPALEYYTRDALAKVFAPCDMILMKIMDNEAGVGDKELEFRSSEDSAYFIYIDHVRDISIKEGEEVVAGQVIGMAGVASEYRVELQVNYMYLVDASTVGTIHYCPLDYGTQDFVNAHTAFAPLSEWKQKDKIDAGAYTLAKDFEKKPY